MNSVPNDPLVSVKPVTPYVNLFITQKLIELHLKEFTNYVLTIERQQREGFLRREGSGTQLRVRAECR